LENKAEKKSLTVHILAIVAVLVFAFFPILVLWIYNFVYQRVRKLPPATNVFFYLIRGDGSQIKIMNKIIKSGEKFAVALSAEDKNGNPAALDGAPAWSLTDDTIGALVVAEDGMSAQFQSAAKVGTCTIQVHADADLGEGVKDLLGELEVIVMPGEAVKITLSAGEVIAE
jgi:hypothetical protein